MSKDNKTPNPTSKYDEKFGKNKLAEKVVKQTTDSLEDYQKMAQELWFNGGSCTGGKPE